MDIPDKLLCLIDYPEPNIRSVSSKMLRGDGGIVAFLLYQLFFLNPGKAIGYLMSVAKPSLHPSIEGKAHDKLAQIIAL
ncbi:hypothetical protein EVAR_51169_1 [Eumeta japonica]|uniref:Uncharacterized protein n=1 Tax=Eumeta variegata TaxID=151549 RepID=A0A4C1XFK2_EUMVA|nr:hypothetical protein EVAR_51169_1 [Eumeta japonica]